MHLFHSISSSSAVAFAFAEHRDPHPLYMDLKAQPQARGMFCVVEDGIVGLCVWFSQALSRYDLRRRKSGDVGLGLVLVR